MATKNSNSSQQTTSSPKLTTMDQLMASFSAKPLSFLRGDEIEGKIISIGEGEVVVDLGAKAEGVLSKKEFSSEELKTLESGSKVSAFIVHAESDSGQIILSRNKSSLLKQAPDKSKKWQRFIQMQSQHNKVKGRIIEVNKGGLLVEVEGTRGFLPTSQIGIETLNTIGNDGGLEQLVGQDITLTVIEVDSMNNRLIFSSRVEISSDIKEKLAKFEAGQKVTGKVAAIAPFGVFVDLNGVEGLIYQRELSWDETQDPAKKFKVGQELESVVISVDKTLAKVSLSLRILSEDPFEKLAENFTVDDVVKGTVTEVTTNGILVKLDDGVDGFIPTAKVELEGGTSYQVGQSANFLVDSVDKQKRRIILAPFLTTTKGLIYK